MFLPVVTDANGLVGVAVQLARQVGLFQGRTLQQTVDINVTEVDPRS